MSKKPWDMIVQEKTEQFLTWNKRRRLIKKEKQKRKNPILDWTEVILSAVFIVLLINQYLFQAYQIPTGSMISTLEEEDRIFVNKLIYGPELLPGQFKLDGTVVPQRGEIIIFESPEYNSKGVEFEILFRVVYMLTFTLVNFDVDKYGKPAKHFLIKRAIGMMKDRLRVKYGNVEIMPAGEYEWYAEEEWKSITGTEYHLQRLFNSDLYDDLEKAVMDFCINNGRLPISRDERESIIRALPEPVNVLDEYFIEEIGNRTLYQVNPSEKDYGEEWRSHELGWYIGTNRIFPMGDNRDNSRDARFFDAVSLDKVLGKAVFRFFPFNRFGGI